MPSPFCATHLKKGDIMNVKAPKYLGICDNKPLLAAVIVVGDKIVTGQTHAQAISEALTAGLLTTDENGYYEQIEEGSDALDLFLTKEGKLINRMETSELMDIGSSEKADEVGLMAKNSHAYIWDKDELVNFILNVKRKCCP
jgi:hypothetical protein